MSNGFELLSMSVEDPLNGWSIGTFGAIGEFRRVPDEHYAINSGPDRVRLATRRGGIGIRRCLDIQILAYDILSSDGETWGNAVAVCLPCPADSAPHSIRNLGLDREALRAQDREKALFDLGIGIGLVSMCVRTDDPELTVALNALEGGTILASEAAVARSLILKLSPHRIMLSPIGRLEVFSPIPSEDGESPDGPHTHLLPKLIASRRTHGANAPIPDGLQPVLMLHPRSPWRDGAGKRTPYDAQSTRDFDRLLKDYGLVQDKRIRADVERAVRWGVNPMSYSWPHSRRGRVHARITLRRLALDNSSAVADWRSLYDRLPEEEDGVNAIEG